MPDGETELGPQEAATLGPSEQSPSEIPEEERDQRSGGEEMPRQAVESDEGAAAEVELEQDEGLQSSYERANSSVVESEKLTPDAETDPAAAFGSQQTLRDSIRAGRDFVGRDRWQAGRDINYYGATVEEPEFNEVPAETLTRLHAIFVEPSGFREALSAGLGVHQSQVFLIYGADHSGKWTCAVNLARELSESRQSGASGDTPRVYQYSRPTSSELSLAEAMRSDELPESAVVLVKDCFERNVHPEELEAAELEELLIPLRKKKSILVLTGDLAREHLEALSVVKLAAHVAQLRKILVKHLEYGVLYEGLPLREEQIEPVVNRWWNRLKPHLATPFHIRQFCSKLAQVLSDVREERSLDKVLLPVAKAVAIGGSQASRVWFDALHPNEKLFGLLVYLFDGAERRWLEELGRQLVRRFRVAPFEWFSDPWEHGLEDAREKIQAIEQGGRLEFEDRLYEREVRWQVENRQHLLWDALEFLVDLNPAEAWVEGWKRQALGVALGKLGIHDHTRLKATLQDMAEDGDKLRAVVPGYALQEMVRGELGTDSHFVIQLLGAWIRSRNHRLMWAAAAALWRVYLALRTTDGDGQRRPVREQTLRLLRQLGMSLNAFELNGQEGDGRKVRKSTGSLDEALERRRRQRIWGMNFLCVVEAMKRITLADPERAALEVVHWIIHGNASQSDLGRRTVRVVYETFARAQYKPSQAQQAPLLSLMPPLLEKASDESLDIETVFLTLRGWLRWPELADRIRAELLDIATYTSSQPRSRLRSIVTRLWLDPQPVEAERAALQLIRSNKRQQKGSDHRERQEVARLVSFWCHGTGETARGIAQAVIVRCYAMDGALPSVPGMGRGVVVVDPALLLPAEPGTLAMSSSSLWRLLALLESRMDLTLLRLGQTEPLDLFDTSLSTIELLPRFAGHRLLMPGLEAVRLPQRESVFVLAPRKPHDFDDLLGQPWLQNLHYLGPSSERGETSEDGYVHLDLAWPPSPQSLERAVSALENHWARALASAPAERWLELVRAFGIEANHSALLETWARDLDGPSATSGPDEDPVRKSLALSLWLAATDLRACLTWIRSWLSLPDEAPDSPAKRAIGAAAAFALIRLYTAYPPEDTGTGRASPLLFQMLAEPLGGQGSDGVDALVRLVRHWLVDSVWAEYLAGDVREGRGRLERWAGKYLYDRPDLASELADRVAARRPAEGTGESWVALAAVVDRLKAQRALENPRSLPNLGPNQRYVLLVIGTGSGNDDLRRHLAAVTANLYGELANESGASIIPAVYRMGECRPFWAGTKERPVPERLLPRGMRLSGLIGPLLETIEGKRDQISTVLLISGAAPIDLDDWVESAWWNKVRLYSNGTSFSVASFATLPEPISTAVSATAAGRETIEERSVATYLTMIDRRVAPKGSIPVGAQS